MSNLVAKANIQIYIVEDQEILRSGISIALSRIEGFNVIGSASDGLTALHQIPDLRPDVVLMDISLPQMSGIEVTAILKQRNPELRVIILSSHEDELNVYSAFNAGASGYCLKDVPGENLQLAIRSVAKGATWVDDRVAAKILQCVDEQMKRISEKSKAPEKVALSQREIEVIRHIADGLKNREIADRLKISISTVRSHINNMAEKLSVNTRTQIALRAQREGLV
ncbi:MAG: response regulator transcription factor [Candidatus Obscuribacterales bacterium]|nr:response regulator transcription factor [Candidatus Obscuribacterales bacterium]